MIKREEAMRLKLKENFNRTKDEQDAIDYFHGTDFYKRLQDRAIKPNKFDSRKSFLLKMHDDKLRDDFLNSFKSINIYNLFKTERSTSEPKWYSFNQ